MLLLVPDIAHLLGKLLLDPRVKWTDKAKVGLVSAYVVSPLDLLPKLIGIGILDDLALIAWVLNSVLKNIDPSILREHWTGPGDVVDSIYKIRKTSRLFLRLGRRLRPGRKLSKI